MRSRKIIDGLFYAGRPSNLLLEMPRYSLDPANGPSVYVTTIFDGRGGLPGSFFTVNAHAILSNETDKDFTATIEIGPELFDRITRLPGFERTYFTYTSKDDRGKWIKLVDEVVKVEDELRAKAERWVARNEMGHTQIKSAAIGIVTGIPPSQLEPLLKDVKYVSLGIGDDVQKSADLLYSLSQEASPGERIYKFIEKEEDYGNPRVLFALMTDEQKSQVEASIRRLFRRKALKSLG